MLKGKTAVLAVSGSIAAYKIANLARMLKKLECNVQVLMTENATRFINPITFESLTGNKCLIDTFDRNFQYSVEHVALAKQADVVLAAPASANVIGKMANGIADDMLTTTILACPCRKIIAPAMNHHMYHNPIVQDNLQKLRHFGYESLEPDRGMLANGDTGNGRMADEETLLAYILRELAFEKDLAGKKVLVTAGPTREAVDPVRYLSNHSTGKMGYAIADAAARMGAEVTLVSGPVSVKASEKGVTTEHVESAREMLASCQKAWPETDIAIMCAAVADYAPSNPSGTKIKREGNEPPQITLVKNPDIAATLGAEKRPGQILVGFALETDSEESNAVKKLHSKNRDMIVLNSLRDPQAGFGTDTNKITIFRQGAEPLRFPVKSKREVAVDILDEIIKLH